MKKWVTLLFIVVPLIALAQVQPFLDVVRHPHAPQIEFLHSRGIVEGYGYGIFRPDITINRAEFLKILMLAVFGEDSYNVANAKCMSDFTGEEQWFWTYVCAAKERGIVDGYPDGTFRGIQTVNLAEALKMTIEAQGLQLPQYPGGPPNWYDPYFDVAASKRIFSEFPYSPGHLLTRSEMSVLIVSLVQPVATVGFSRPDTVSDDDTGDDDTGDDDDNYSFCGDGTIGEFEECDDENFVDGDGCDVFCEVEEGWDCASGTCIFATPSAQPGGAKCATYMRFGEVRRVCATCGNGECESFERCTSSNCDANMCTSDCGELYCPTDCEEGAGVPICGNGIREADEQCDDGNNVNGDGCSSICIIVSEPIRHAAMRIEQKPASTLDQSQGANDVLLLAFDAVAGRQDVSVSGLELVAESGNVTDAQNYRLMVDEDGDGIAERLAGTATVGSDIITFRGVSVLVKDGVYKRMEVRADINDATQSSTLAIGFATDRPQYVIAYGAVDGNELTGIETDLGGCDRSICWIAVYTQNAQQVTILDKGNLYVTEDSVPVRSRQLRAGELSEVIFRLKMRAEGEDIKVKDISIAGGTDSIDYLELFEGSSQTAFTSARSLICDSAVVGLFCAKPADLIVPKDSEMTILVRAFVRPDNPAEVSGDSFTLFLTTGTSPQPAIEAQGIGSDQDLIQNNGDNTATGEVFIGTNGAGANVTIMGSAHDIVASNIFKIENAHTDTDGTVIPLGDVTFAAFRFEASQKLSSDVFPVHIRDLVFSLAADNVEIDPATVVIYNKLNPNSKKSCATSAATGIITVTCSDLETSAVSTTVNQGASVTLSLRADIVSAQSSVGAATMQASLATLGNRSEGGTVEWDDGTTTFDWVDMNETRVRSTLYRSE